ncbi:MAG: hypothetical protein LBT64_04015 [Puniceicoccales bacterium]|jgi:hypothetical protein|nr:hypothetical protein [Puniceicoccales bacterium]
MALLVAIFALAVDPMDACAVAVRRKQWYDHLHGTATVEMSQNGGKSSSRAFRNLSKKFPRGNAVRVGKKSHAPGETRLNMQKLNKFQHRGSHSAQSEIPVVRMVP